MSGTSKKTRLIVLFCVWLPILVCVGGAFKYFVVPMWAKQEVEHQKQEEQQVLVATGSSSQYEHEITLNIDGFSGYAVLRSQAFSDELGSKGIKVNLKDDGADYVGRLGDLYKGDSQMAVFTAATLVVASAELGKMPATIVDILDETRGADAIVAYKDVIPNLDALNDPATKFVLTTKSPSETLTRVVMSRFRLDRVSPNPFVEMAGSDKVYDHYRKNKDIDQRIAWVMWQPWVTKALDNPNMHVVIASDRTRGYIVDVMVASRDFLVKNPNVVRDVVESYKRAAYVHRSNMVQLIMDDSRRQGLVLSETQSQDLVDGIWFKNTKEGYAHFGLDGGRTLQHIEEILDNCIDVLVSTHAISSDPTGGQPNLLFYDKVLAELQSTNFHPGIAASESIRDDTVTLRALTDQEWGELSPVGTFDAPTLIFARGTDFLTEQSKSDLDKMVTQLNTFPHYYVIVQGNASRLGDLDANKSLALARAEAAKNYLVGKGIPAQRIKAVGGDPSGQTSVSFVLGELPY